jgi:membrane peptidoglycan carboxypeptidase
MPIGQAEAATPLQVLDAYNTIANGGVFVPPRLVQATIDAGGERHPTPLAATHRVVPEQVASELTTMFEGVVQSGVEGTAPAAAIPGYTVAGKTGTAQIPWPNRPGYQPGAYMATFVGFVPAQRPALSILVNLDQPSNIYGGAAAAPVFAALAEYALHTLNIPSAGAPPAGSAPAEATVPFATPPPTTTTTTVPKATTTTTVPKTSTTTSPTTATTSPAAPTPTTTTTTTAPTSPTTTTTTNPHAVATDLRTKARPATLAGAARAPDTA